VGNVKWGHAVIFFLAGYMVARYMGGKKQTTGAAY